MINWGSNLTRRRETRREVPVVVRRRDDRTVRATGGNVLGLGACATACGGEETVKRSRLRLCIIGIRALQAPSRIRHSATAPTSALLYSLKTAFNCNRAFKAHNISKLFFSPMLFNFGPTRINASKVKRIITTLSCERPKN